MTLTLALVFLGETLGPIKIIAIGLLVLGPALAARVEKKGKAAPASSSPAAVVAPARPGFAPRYAEGYLFAFLSIFGYGSSPILIKAGLQNGSVGDSLAAGLVSYVFATIVIAIVVVAIRQVDHVRDLRAEPAGWFVVAGVLVFLSHMFRYMALALAPATIVAPIMRVQTLFRFYFSWILTREHEVFENSVIAGTLVSLAGAVLLSLDTGLVLSALPLPDALEAALRWQWP